MTFPEVLARVLITYHTKSLPKHPTWEGVPAERQIASIKGEFGEWLDAVDAGDVDGEHGEAAEILDTMVVMGRRYMELTKGTP